MAEQYETLGGQHSICLIGILPVGSAFDWCRARFAARFQLRRYRLSITQFPNISKADVGAIFSPVFLISFMALIFSWGLRAIAALSSVIGHCRAEPKRRPFLGSLSRQLHAWLLISPTNVSDIGEFRCAVTISSHAGV